MASTGKAQLRELWEVYLKAWLSPEPKPCRCPLTMHRANPALPGCAAPGSLPTHGESSRMGSWARMGRWAGLGQRRQSLLVPSGPWPHSHFKTPTPPKRCPTPWHWCTVFLPAAMAAALLLLFMPRGPQGHTKTILLSNEFLCLHSSSIKMFLLISNLNFPWFLPYSP